MLTTDLKPLQIDDLIHHCTELSLLQNAGLACVKMRKAFGQQRDENLIILNSELNQIMLDARIRMKNAFDKYIQR